MKISRSLRRSESGTQRSREISWLAGSFLMAVTASHAFSQYPSGDEILRRIDKNFRAENRISESRMVIHGRRAKRTIEAKSWVEGAKRSFTEYLAPAREKGTKMLKLENQLWTYTPATDRTIKISGHMLRQSVMGSDLSYEDLMEDPELHKLYRAEVVAEENFSERECWVLELTATQKNISYYSRKIWVDKARYIPLRENRYAKSGKLLKTTEVKDVMQVEPRWVYSHIIFKDVLQRGNGTEFFITSIEFDVDIPRHVFSKAALRK